MPSIPRMNCLIYLGLHGSVESGVKTISATSHQVSIILVPDPWGMFLLGGPDFASSFFHVPFMFFYDLVESAVFHGLHDII